MTRCSLCLTDTHLKCNSCGHHEEGPIVYRFTVWKRKPAFIRKEHLDVCQDCERAIWKAIKMCKDKARDVR